jgi:hypothetical protein
MADLQALVTSMADELRPLARDRRVAGMFEAQWIAGARQTLHVTADYFEVLDVPFTGGRAFAASDPADGVVVINEAFARWLWPSQPALGQVIPRDDARVQDRALGGREVVGVVVDRPLRMPTAWVPAELADARVLLAEAPVNAAAAAATGLASRRSWTAGVEVIAGDDWVSPVLGPALFAAGITTGFGVLALLLGVVGFFSLLEYSVQQRTRELGIRRALGAGTREIAASVVMPAARPLLRGLLFGSIIAGALAAFMRVAQLPPGIDPFDPVVYLAVAGLTAVTAGLAALAPTRRALRIEPMHALRVE